MRLFLSIALLFMISACGAQPSGMGHPHLTVTQQDIATISSRLAQVPLAQQALQRLREKIDAKIAEPMNVPLPMDAGGGFTHEQHKRNYSALYDAALLYQITKDARYSDYVHDMLLAYVELYPALGIHPKRKEQSPGKLFWQSLNEAVWLVHVIQAYDMVFDALSEADRLVIEKDLLRPVAHFLSAGQPATFDKIHNHGTWAAAAVGMTGYVLGDQTLVKQALFGLDMSGEAGFLKQLEVLFSPDGYYAEGPYYQRYALMPFVLFAKAIQVNEPQRKIFEFRNKVLLKAIRTTMQLSYNKLFFGINDAIKDKGIDTIEMVHGVAIAYEITEDRSLLDIAQQQNHTLLTGYGFKVAEAIERGLAEPFRFTSLQLRDGKDGTNGALSIFRNGFGHGHQALVMKNTSHGLGHGHFDKLHWLYFDNGEEIITDYGAARFLNIEAKYGGHYLPENNAWAKQTIAHNTVVVDEQSHFNADWQHAQNFAPQILFYDANDRIKISSASINNAYQGTFLRRTLAMVTHASLEYPLVVDIFNVQSKKPRQYDLPLHYQGQLVSYTMPLTAHVDELIPLGRNNGYQYLWDRARGRLHNGMSQVTWLHLNRFYTYSFLGDDNQQLIFTQLGANDPDFNLRNQSSLIRRVGQAENYTFVSALETHGEYNGTAEFTVNAQSQIDDIKLSVKDGAQIVSIMFGGGNTLSLAIADHDRLDAEYKINHNGKLFDWVGPYALFDNTKNHEVIPGNG